MKMDCFNMLYSEVLDRGEKGQGFKTTQYRQLEYMGAVVSMGIYMLGYSEYLLKSINNLFLFMHLNEYAVIMKTWTLMFSNVYLVIFIQTFSKPILSLQHETVK